MLGFDEFYEGLILEAKSPEEVKRILEHGFPNVPNDIINAIVDLDPTKRKSSSRWAVAKYENESDLLKKSINNGLLEKVFEYFQDRNNTGLNLSDIKSLKEAINYLPDVDPVLTKNGDGGPEDDYEIVYDTPEWKIAVPNTYPASQKLGSGCRWCTAGAFRNGEGYFNDYTKHGPLWINFDMSKGEKCPMDSKEYPYTRYQFCFETKDFRDCNDEEIESFEDIGLPEDVKEFYEEQDESYGTAIEEGNMTLEDRWEAYEDERYRHGICLKSIDEYDCYLMLYREYNDDFIYSENDPYYLYDDDDTNDPICYEEIDVDSNYIENRFDGHNCILLKSRYDELLFCFYDNDYSTYFQVIKGPSEIKITDSYVMADNEKELLMYLLSEEKVVTFKGDLKRPNINTFTVSNGLKIKDSEKIFDESSLYVDVLFDNNEHCLLKYDSELKSFKSIVLYDTPNDPQKGFEVYFDSNGKPHVETSEFEYGYESINLLRDYMIYLKLNSRFCIVRRISSGKYDNDKFNVFDKEENGLVFDEDMHNILKVNENDVRYLAVSKTSQEAFFFDLFTGKVVGDTTYNSIKGKQYKEGDRIIFGQRITRNGQIVDLIRYEDGRLYVQNRFDNVVDNFIDYKMMLVVGGKAGLRTLCDYDGNVILDKFKIVPSGSGVRFNGFIHGTMGNSREFLFSLAEKKYIIENVIDFKNGAQFALFFGTDKNLILFYEYNGTVTKMIFCEKIVAYGSGCVAYLNNNRIYFIEATFREIYPQNGIDASQISKINSYGACFVIKTINNNFILYQPHQKRYGVENERFRFVDNNASNADEEKAKEEADRLFGVNSVNGINEIKSIFNSLFNRINKINF